MNIYCINIDKRNDRWNLMVEQFHTIQEINLIRISAIENKHGWIGCGLSHLKVVDNYMNKYEHLIVIEDDCKVNDIINFKNSVEQIIKWLDMHNDKWTIFNGNPSFINESNCKILENSPKIVECKGGTTNFIIYNNKKHDEIKYKLQIYRKKLLQYKLEIENGNRKVHRSHKGLPIIDKFLSNNFIFVTMVPYLTRQFESQSDIENKNISYDNSLNLSEKKLLELFDNENCQIFSDDTFMNIHQIAKIDNYDPCLNSVNRGIKLMNSDIFVELRKRKDRTQRIYWGADFEFIKPEKFDVNTILIDHQYYDNKSSSLYQKNKTNTIIQSLPKYKTNTIIQSLPKYKNKNHNTIINHIGSGKINDVTDNYIIEKFYHRHAMDSRYIYKYYNKADIFVVTHPESFGLCTIECASAGTLIVQPDGYIKKEIISLLHNVSIIDTENIDWSNIISQINVNKSIRLAKKFSYKNAVNDLYKRMKAISTIEGTDIK